MFVKVIRKNENGYDLETIINTDSVISVIEKHLDPIELFDVDGDLVETKEPDHKEYVVLMEGGKHIRLIDSEYAKLEEVLLK